MGLLASRLANSEQQRAEKAANAAAMQAAQKAEEIGKRGGRLKSGTLACLPYSQSREVWSGGQVLLLRAVQLTKNNSETKHRAIFFEKG